VSLVPHANRHRFAGVFSDCNVFNVLAETVSELCVLADFIYLFIHLFYFILFYLSIHSLKE